MEKQKTLKDKALAWLWTALIGFIWLLFAMWRRGYFQ